ncbi:MAG: restriction endonuclease subunit S [Sulfurimonas sp.]|nr:restriction endonuclease subunit S [Sulfurimonas sp.]
MSKSWSLVALGDVLKKSEESVSIDPNAHYREVTIKLWGKGVVLRREASGTEMAASRRAIVRKGQFILSRIDARNGAFGLVPELLDGAVVSNDFPSFNLNLERLEPKFLEWLSKTSVFVDLCKAASEGTTNRVRLKEEKFLAMAIPLPPLTEQQWIVARIEELAAKINEARGLRRQAVEEAEALLQSTSRQLFSMSKYHGSAVLASLCTDIIDCLHSNAIYSDSGIPTLRSPDVGWGKLFPDKALKTSEDEYLRRTRRGELVPGDIIIVREGGGTGKAGIVQEGQKMSLGQRVMQVRPDSRKILPQFLLYQWLSPIIQQDHIAPLSKGSASPHLNIGAIKKFPIVLPSIEEQRRIVSYLDNLGAKVDTLKHHQAETARELDAMLPSILDKAFKAQL